VFDIKIEGLGGLLKDLDKLQRKVIPKVTRQALNDTARQTRTFASKKIREQRKMKAAIVKRDLRIIPARGRKLIAEVIAYEKPVPVISYKSARQTSTCFHKSA